jgi:hypothetical protein
MALGVQIVQITHKGIPEDHFQNGQSSGSCFLGHWVVVMNFVHSPQFANDILQIIGKQIGAFQIGQQFVAFAVLAQDRLILTLV